MENNFCFSVEHLSFAYGERQIFSDLSLCIPKGKITTLMGSNGCGKSTLFQLLTKNLTPQEGEIYLGDQSLEEFSLREFARKAAIVHQNNTAPADLQVEQLVEYGRIPFARLGRSENPTLDERLVERALKITGTAPLRKKPVQELSGGQRQRVWIAMALAQGTKTLLLDEPTTYLDVRYQLQILRLVRELNRRCGMTILMVLHDINQALAYSDEIAALSPHGKLVAQGRPEQVITQATLREMYRINLEMIQHNGRPLVLTV